MDRNILSTLGYEHENWSDYMTEQIMENSNVLSENDFAAICKRRALEKGFELSSQTTKNGGWCYVYEEDDMSFEDYVFYTKKENENEAIFKCFLWVLEKEDNKEP
jgi:hypothetical protein